MAGKNWSNKVAQIKERQMVRELPYAERIAYIQKKNGLPPTQPTAPAQPVAPQPVAETCPGGGAHEYKPIHKVGCYVKSQCTKCGDTFEVDSSD